MIFSLIREYLLKIGFSEIHAQAINLICLLILTSILLFLIDIMARKVMISIANRFAEKSQTNFDNILVKNKVPRNIAHIVPLYLALALSPQIFTDYDYLSLWAIKILKVFGIMLTLWIIRSILNTLKDYFKTLPSLKDKPIDSYIQVFMIFAGLLGFMFAFAIITDTTIWKFFTAMGAASAVLMLVFKDTILGFIASIQVSVNDMVRIGDWITFDKYGADGDVIEINLSTVKVQNFDKTITTIPTYALISDSFKNWRGMEDASGRRIKRAVIIKQDSIKFLTNDDIKELSKIELISDYLYKRQEIINDYNAKNVANDKLSINGRRMTNIGVFRKYIEVYAKNHPAINKDMIIMARQLAPTPQGIPIEIYAFSSDKNWQNYEYIMADIFDHLLAAVPYFKLGTFELTNYVINEK